ncbi:MAG: adenine phosphoribosyltransferase [Nitrososphaerales archaeon]|jgi:adenine phosphoribosyltransferase
MVTLEQEIKRNIRTIQDYPKKGITFKDLTTLWKNGLLAKKVTNTFVSEWKDRKVDKIVGIEARGFIVGAPIADRLGIGFVPARKLGKLPGKKLGVNYELEYGRQGLEIHSDAISKGDRVLIVDDLLATGGTARAAGALVEKSGGKVLGFAFVAELNYLKGRERLTGYEIQSLAKYDSE